MKLFAAVLIIAMAGCGVQAATEPDIMRGTHKVWSSDDRLSYQNDKGYGCGHITRLEGGRVYQADVVNWSAQAAHNLETDWNSFTDAEKWVERWCQP